LQYSEECLSPTRFLKSCPFRVAHFVILI
jgi:hypothetical protein